MNKRKLAELAKYLPKWASASVLEREGIRYTERRTVAGRTERKFFWGDKSIGGHRQMMKAAQVSDVARRACCLLPVLCLLRAASAACCLLCAILQTPCVAFQAWADEHAAAQADAVGASAGNRAKQVFRPGFTTMGGCQHNTHHSYATYNAVVIPADPDDESVVNLADDGSDEEDEVGGITVTAGVAGTTSGRAATNSICTCCLAGRAPQERHPSAAGHAGAAAG